MLKKRIVATVLVRHGIVVQSIGFNSYLPVGHPEIAVEFLSEWGADEIVLVDILATRERRTISSALVEKVAKKCIVPLTVGGGIRSVESVNELLQHGADKVAVNTLISQKPQNVTAIAEYFGNQCIVASIDYIQNDASAYQVYDYKTRVHTKQNLIDYCKYCESIGAGEIYVTAVQRDGAYSGYDTDVLTEVVQNVSIPVIASGGAGTPEHFADVFLRANVQAASAANFFHFSEHAVITTKAFLSKINIPIRLETSATYTESNLGTDFRLVKKDDAVLENLLFVKIEKEII